MPPDLRQRARGAIVGVCACDALGGPLQFMHPTEFRPITLEEPLRPVAPFDMPAGSWSDDGSMTLALADSLVHSKGKFDREDVLTRWLAWSASEAYCSQDQEFDMGRATNLSLVAWKKSRGQGRPTESFDATMETIRRFFDNFESSGNGSLMRCAPIGVVMHDRPASEQSEATRAQGEVTHPYSACICTTLLYTRLMVAAMKGVSKQQLHNLVHDEYLEDSDLRNHLAAYPTLDSWKAKTPPLCEGWVITTLEVVLWAFFTTESFAEGALKCVNTGGDSDTTGAVYGGLAGAFYGMDSIPEHWITGLAKKDFVVEVADKVANLAAS